MNNKEKYKNSINKIEVDTNVLNSVIEKSRAYKKRSNDIMEKKTKFRIFRQAAITIATLLTVSAASYASYVAITGNSVLKKSTVQ